MLYNPVFSNVTTARNVLHCSDVIMGAMAPHITSLMIVYSTIYSGVDQRLRHWPSWEEFTGNAENVSIWWRHHEKVICADACSRIGSLPLLNYKPVIKSIVYFFLLPTISISFYAGMLNQNQFSTSWKQCLYECAFHTTLFLIINSHAFVNTNMMTSSNGNIFRVTGHLYGEFTSEFPAQRPETRSFDVFFDLCLNERLSKQS